MEANNRMSEIARIISQSNQNEKDLLKIERM